MTAQSGPSLLKEDGTAPKRISVSKVHLVWPTTRLPSDILLRIGFWVFLGAGIALTVVLPALFLVFGCVAALAITILGGSLGALL